MLNEIAEFEAYTKKPEYKRDGKNDNSFLGRFTCEGIQGFEGFPRVLTIIARGYMFKNGSADIEYARRAIYAWCSIPDKTDTQKEEWHFKTDFRQYHGEFSELVSEEDLAQGSLYPPLADIRRVSAVIGAAVAECAYAHGLATNPRPDDLEAAVAASMYEPRG